MKYLQCVKTAILGFLCVNGGVFAHDFNQPQDAVNAYIKAVSSGLGEQVSMAFLATARIQYFDPKGEYRTYTRDEFAELVDGGGDWNAEIVIKEIKQTGKAANATVEFTWGANAEKGYVDYLNLIKTGSSWHISDKVAQYIER